MDISLLTDLNHACIIKISRIRSPRNTKILSLYLSHSSCMRGWRELGGIHEGVKCNSRWLDARLITLAKYIREIYTIKVGDKSCVKDTRGPQWQLWRWRWWRWLKCQRDILKIFGSAHASRCTQPPMERDGPVVSELLLLEETVRVERKLRISPTTPGVVDPRIVRCSSTNNQCVIVSARH